MNGSDTRYQISLFSMFDYKGAEDNLASMAAKGWEIEHAGASIWRFKKVKPSNKKFCIVLSMDASKQSPVSVGSQNLLEELRTKDGWEEMIKRKQMHIFCADAETEPLKIDETARIESVRMVMKKTFVPNWAKALFIMLILAFSNGIRYFSNSLYCDEDTIWAFLIALNGVLIAGFALLGYLFWQKISEKRISEGGTCVSAVWFNRVQTVLLLGFLITSIGYFVINPY